MNFPKTSSFPGGNPFNAKPQKILPPRVGADPLPTGVTARTDVIEVPINVLESWYSVLDDLRAIPGNRLSSHSETIADLRDEVYAYLR